MKQQQKQQDNPISLDTRSLALFRIGLGLYLLYDIYTRLSLGPFDIAWYTSNEPTSFLAPTDSPHGAPLHRFWFYRGSTQLQYTLFAITALLAAAFCVGCFQTTPAQALVTKVPLFLLVVSYQNRNMLNHDGSDSFCRHLLFWACFLPLADQWSVDDRWFQRRSPRPLIVTRLACLALTTQILLMYWGTVLHRTVDRWETIAESEWMPPKLSAVHYVMNGCFARRHNALTEFLRQHATVTQCMTVSAMLVEFVVPFLAWMGGKRRHYYAAVIALLHFGLLCTVRLPNWQWIGIITQVVWIPTSFWGVPAEEKPYKKTDGDPSQATTTTTPLPRPPPNPVSRFIQYFFFAYMLYNFMGMRGWIRQHDNGDIGEGLRLNQNWVMFSSVSRTAENFYLTGTLHNGTEMDLWAYLSSKDNVSPSMYVFGDRDTYIQDMSSRYPTARWERTFSSWAREKLNKRNQRMHHFGKALCRLIPDLQQIEFRRQYLLLQPPGSPHRYNQYPQQPDSVTTVLCDPVPSLHRPESSV